MKGKREWIIPDGFMNDTQKGGFKSHEAICVLNLSGQPAHIKLTVYFEDRPPLGGFQAECEPDRTNHIRLDQIVNAEEKHVPYGVPYAVLVQSDMPIVAQHSRMDVSQPDLTLMTTIPYGIS